MEVGTKKKHILALPFLGGRRALLQSCPRVVHCKAMLCHSNVQSEVLTSSGAIAVPVCLSVCLCLSVLGRENHPLVWWGFGCGPGLGAHLLAPSLIGVVCAWCSGPSGEPWEHYAEPTVE